MTTDRIVIKGGKKLRCGYTTGTCAAAAASVAAALLCTSSLCAKNALGPMGFSQLALHEPRAASGKPIFARIKLPDGETAVLEVMVIERSDVHVKCGVIKDAGDDPDITDGMMICASVTKSEIDGVHIDGGEGVGRVTKKGLDQPVGAAAINTVPRRMIEAAVIGEMKAAGYNKGLSVVISIPGGKERALKTLNPMLGIEGGLSVLGTSGIVEPMSEQALIDTIAVEIRMRRAQNEDLLIMTPGNYGLDFLKQEFGVESKQVIKISNYIGDSLDIAVAEGTKGIILVGHIGKLIKIAGGIMNTHSKHADARMELMTAYAALAGVPLLDLQRIMQAVTTDAGLEILREVGYMEKVMDLLVDRIRANLCRRAGENTEIGVIMFSNVYGRLGQTENIVEMLR